jgi:acetylxylan esterase
VKPFAPLVVGVHWCNGNATDFYSGTKYARDADEKGYIVVYPSATTSDGCWDVSSAATLKHLGGGDSLAIHSMVRYTQRHHSIDPRKIFVTGISSGAMMTEVLLGAYPDVFAAGSGFAGVPFACFAGPNTWNTECSTGQIHRTPKEWGDLVRAAYPRYRGKRPRLQLFHGTEDEVLAFVNMAESVKQWTNVLHLSEKPIKVQQDQPREGWIRSLYGRRGELETVVEVGQPHNLVVVEDEGMIAPQYGVRL